MKVVIEVLQTLSGVSSWEEILQIYSYDISMSKDMLYVYREPYEEISLLLGRLDYVYKLKEGERVRWIRE